MHWSLVIILDHKKHECIVRAWYNNRTIRTFCYLHLNCTFLLGNYSNIIKLKCLCWKRTKISTVLVALYFTICFTIRILVLTRNKNIGITISWNCLSKNNVVPLFFWLKCKKRLISWRIFIIQVNFNFFI